jgi:hypothetical protein
MYVRRRTTRNTPIGQVRKCVLRLSTSEGETGPVADGAWKRADVQAVLAGIWDIKMLLLQLVQLLGDDEEEADE